MLLYMPTLVLDLVDPPEIEALIERRRLWGADRHDEVWEGVLHMPPAPNEGHTRIGAQLARIVGPLADTSGLVITLEFNIGTAGDHRIPDLGLHRETGWGVWASTAALAIEIVSPGDESWKKLDFYAAHQVDEVLIVDPATRAVHWFALAGGSYEPVEGSRVIALTASELVAQIYWPPVD
jgi:Uma2 family endonuclease